MSIGKHRGREHRGNSQADYFHARRLLESARAWKMLRQRTSSYDSCLQNVPALEQRNEKRTITIPERRPKQRGLRRKRQRNLRRSPNGNQERSRPFSSGRSWEDNED